FERYTEKARRVIFFARYEASQFGSAVIETEHLLLGILRDDARITRMLPAGAPETTRAQIDARIEIRERVSTSLDLRLSNASKRLLREGDSLAAKLLEPFGVKLERFRTKVEVRAAYEGAEGVWSSRDRQGIH
ncbi:MAG TPA: Clp protease N-terminal domain-containing protein, partial [Candidatus Sulfotelmatobacter sp.]